MEVDLILMNPEHNAGTNCMCAYEVLNVLEGLSLLC